MTKQIILAQLEKEHTMHTKRLQGIAAHPFMTPGKRHLATENAKNRLRQLERQMAEITRL